MKQILKSFAVLALAAFAASCAKEQATAPSEGETEVSFTLAAPVLQTRAIADGSTVDKVSCNVYNKDGNLLKGTDETPISKVVDMTGGKATFSVRLVTGQEYSFIFWAYKANNGGESDYYTLDAENKTVTVSYDGATSNDESRDAFYAYVAPFKITGAYSAKVELKRPFAQLNFGVEKDDIEAAKAADITVSKSSVTLTGLANVLHFDTGEVEGEEKAEFTLAACPTEDLTVDETTYGYVAMNYVLVGKNAQSLTDAKLTIANDTETINTLEVTNIPLQGNYRTNVVGNLFTSKADFNIVVDTKFEDDIVKKVVVVTATDIASANTVIKDNSESDIIEVKFTAVPDDAGDASTSGSANAISTAALKKDGVLNIELSDDDNSSLENTTLYIGKYTIDETKGTTTGIKAESANEATVNITIPEGTKISKLVIDDDTKTVTINKVNASSFNDTSVIGELVATTSKSTLIIEKGQTIKKLTFHKGGLEIHGTVEEVEISEEDANAKQIFVRECENLSKTIYEVLKPHIEDGYEGFQIGKTWNIADTETPVKLDGVGYASLQEAIDAAGTERVTINLVDDIVCDDTVTIPADKIIVLNANGHNITFKNGEGKIVVYGTAYIADFSIWGQLSAEKGGTLNLGSGYAES